MFVFFGAEEAYSFCIRLAGANQRLFMKTISISGLDETLQEYTKVW